jgi:hypothetical protein
VSLPVAPRAAAFLEQEKDFAVATDAGTVLIFRPDPAAWRRRAEMIAP